ncbi:hypothetical protein [Nocardioides jensenii]|uniref:hypothetical protein n=1 Tax=Nocardioides jensenii TaxID=1843 RepID=UPI0008309215|nr:hypothetical protein [Nocardioides jensenii]
MFANHCTACDQTMLIFPSQVTGMARIEGVTAMTYTCWCGSEQLWHDGLTAGATEPATAATVA